jgi:hypothetical protein
MQIVKINVIKVTEKSVIVEGYFGNGVEKKRLSKNSYQVVGDLYDNKVAYIVDDCFITRTPSDI